MLRLYYTYSIVFNVTKLYMRMKMFLKKINIYYNKLFIILNHEPIITVIFNIQITPLLNVNVSAAQ